MLAGNRGETLTRDEIRAIRKKIGLSQAKIARILGMTQQSYSRLESGNRQPTRQQVAAIKMLDLLHQYNLIDEAMSMRIG